MGRGAITLVRKVGIAAAALVVLLIFWRFWWMPQQHNVNSLKQQIDGFNQQIEGLSTTGVSKKKLEQQLSLLKQQLQGLPDNLASKKQLEQQLSVLKKQVDDLSDKLSLQNQLDLEKNRLFLEKDKVNVQNAIYASLIQALGGIFFFVTAYLSWRNLQATEDKQITERFTKAVEQLGSDKIEVRLGGIYSLERIAKDSPEDHWTIMEVLASFIQEKSPLLIPKQQKKRTMAERCLAKRGESATQEPDLFPASKDVKAALTVIGRRKDPKPDRNERIILRFTNLREVDLREADLRGVDLSGADLRKADLREADLRGVDLSEAHLNIANLLKVKLQQADFSQANLEDATLTQSSLQGATFTNARLKQAKFWGCDGLTPNQVKTAIDFKKARYDNNFCQQLNSSSQLTRNQ